MLKVEEGGILSFYASLFHKLVIGNVGKALIASAYASIHCIFSKLIESLSAAISSTRFGLAHFL